MKIRVTPAVFVIVVAVAIASRALAEEKPKAAV